MEHGLKEQGFRGFTGYDGGADVAALERGVAGVESERSLLFVGSVAADAPGVQQGLDAFEEVAVGVGKGLRISADNVAGGHDR